MSGVNHIPFRKSSFILSCVPIPSVSGISKAQYQEGNCFPVPHVYQEPLKSQCKKEKNPHAAVVFLFGKRRAQCSDVYRFEVAQIAKCQNPRSKETRNHGAQYTLMADIKLGFPRAGR